MYSSHTRTSAPESSIASVATGDINQLEIMLQQAFDVLTTDDYGLTALFYAVLGGRDEEAALLLEHGGRDLAMAATANCVTCLYLACQNGLVAQARLFADVGEIDLISRTTGDGCCQPARPCGDRKGSYHKESRADAVDWPERFLMSAHRLPTWEIGCRENAVKCWRN